MVARALITYGLFPVTFVAGMGAAISSLHAGWSPGVTLAGITFATILIVALFERVHPAYPDWNRSRGDVGTDLKHGLSQVLLPPMLEAGLRAGLLTAALAVGVEGGLWPHDWPLLAQLPLALIVSQFFEYWAHRLMHTNPLLWRLHATHHSAERLYWLNAGRFHPLDITFLFTAAIAPLVLLGAGPEVTLLYTCWATVHGLFQHCNVHVRLGPLNYIFSMAELHRWHHSVKLTEANANYGNNILLWDIVFGTVYWPKDRDASEVIGFENVERFPTGWAGQIASPWTWRRLELEGQTMENSSPP